MAPTNKNPVSSRRKVSTKAGATANPERLTLTLSREDMESLQKVADANLRSMSAQALFFIRVAMAQDPIARAA